MSYTNKNPDDEMSMEDILSSIRKYVSEDKSDEHNEENKDGVSEEIDNDAEKDNIISLSESQIVRDKIEVQPEPKESDTQVYSEKSTLSAEVVNPEPTIVRKKTSPFEQLTNALNAYGKNKVARERSNTAGSRTVDQLFSEIAERVIQQWVDTNMEIFVEKIVMREIEKIKAE